jgi:hypothetical protein
MWEAVQYLTFLHHTGTGHEERIVETTEASLKAHHDAPLSIKHEQV